jgi:hypothetical protein
LWRARSREAARWLLAALLAVAAWWTFELLGRAADWAPWLRTAVVLLGVASAIVVLLPRAVAALVAPLVAGTLLLAPTAYSLQTASTAHTGALPTAGPASSGGFRPGGGRGGPGGQGGTAQRGGFPAGGFAPGGTAPNFRGRQAPQAGGQAPQAGGAAPAGGRGGMPGGLGGATTVSSALVTALNANAGDYEWVAATVSANNAASLELATGHAVMSLGGFNGTDPAITLSTFQKLVTAGKIHYFVADQQGFIGSTAANISTAYAIQQWVQSHYTAKTVGGTTVYDLGS